MDVINTIGRRKASIARVYLKPGKGNILINDKDVKAAFGQEKLVRGMHDLLTAEIPYIDGKDFFPTSLLQYKIHQPFNLTKTEKKFDVQVNVNGGGITGQVEAIRLGISRALCEVDEAHRPTLKAEGLLTRDPRMVERKKSGQKKARKKFQFSKR